MLIVNIINKNTLFLCNSTKITATHTLSWLNSLLVRSAYPELDFGKVFIFSWHLEHLDLQLVSSCQIYSRSSFWLCSYVPFAGQMSCNTGMEGCTSASWLHILCDWHFLPGAGRWNLQHRDIPVVQFKAKHSHIVMFHYCKPLVKSMLFISSILQYVATVPPTPFWHISKYREVQQQQQRN